MARTSEEINALNPEADPDKPYVQAGDTGGYLVGVGPTISEGRSITEAQRAANTQAALAAGIDQSWIDEFERSNPGDSNRYQEAYFSDAGVEDTRTQSGGGGGGGNNLADQWTGGNQSSWYAPWFEQWRSEMAAEKAEQKAKADQLYSTIMSKASQGPITRNDPSVRGPADAYSANAERAGRDYIADVAEAIGPLGNVRGEQRMMAEKIGQNTGAFEANQLSQQLQAQRDEIANYLAMAAGLLSADQMRNAQAQLATLDQAIAEQSLDVQRQGLANGLSIAGMNNDLGLRRLGLDEWDRGMYWDLFQKGLM